MAIIRSQAVKAIVIADTFVSGTPVFAGEVIELEKSDFDELSIYKKAVALDEATEEQKKLVKAREATASKK
jgi:hypothetical protein